MAEVLVVDDDPDIRAMMTEALGCAGHEVFSAANGREGVHHALAIQPDLIVIDVFMPEQDGLQAIRTLRREMPQLAILAISGRSPLSSPMLTAALQLGAVNVLEKPFDALMLRAAVEATLETCTHCKRPVVPVNPTKRTIPERERKPVSRLALAAQLSGSRLATALAKLLRDRSRREGT